MLAGSSKKTGSFPTFLFLVSAGDGLTTGGRIINMNERHKVHNSAGHDVDKKVGKGREEGREGETE